METNSSMLIGQLLFREDALTAGGCLELISQLREAQSFLELRYARSVGAVERQIADEPKAPVKPASQAAGPPRKRGRKPRQQQPTNGLLVDQSLPLEQPATAYDVQTAG